MRHVSICTLSANLGTGIAIETGVRMDVLE
jgi:hypothetical protein